MNASRISLAGAARMAAHERVGAPQRLTGVRRLLEQDVCWLFHGCGHYPPSVSCCPAAAWRSPHLRYSNCLRLVVDLEFAMSVAATGTEINARDLSSTHPITGSSLQDEMRRHDQSASYGKALMGTSIWPT